MFTPWQSLLGGALIGLAASILLVFDGRIAGISGIAGRLLAPGAREGTSAGEADDRGWRLTFLAGLLAGGLVLRLVAPATLAGAASLERPLPMILAGGLLVGVGTQLGSGCTSGHGVCGISRGAVRSVVATLVFMGAGMLVASLVPGLLGQESS